MVPISEEVKAKIRELGAGGLKKRDILKKIWELFQKRISASSLYYILDPERVKRRVERVNAKKKGGKKRAAVDSAGETPEAIVKEIHEKINELGIAYLETLKLIRSELIAAVAKLRQQ